MTGRMPNPRGSFWARLTRGTRWTWTADAYRDGLPADLDETVMGLEATDRHHAKQGRSTARVVFHRPSGPLAVYLKRHYKLPWKARLAALIHPSGAHSPAAAEFRHLSRAAALGVTVPSVVAAGERVGPWGRLQSFLMIAELTGSDELNVALPRLKAALDPSAFERLKRGLVREMAETAATLHRARVFHKDLYLCHFFLDESRLNDPGRRLALIDLHRLGEHRVLPDRWRWKDLGQLLYSTEGVDGVSPRDVSRFWVHYRRSVPMWWPGLQARMVAWKAARYGRHNRDS